MKITILGSGCPTCQSLHKLVEQVVKDNSIQAEIEYLSGSDGIQEIINQGIMGSPVLMINNQVVAIGSPSPEEILDFINKSTEKKE